MRPPFRSEFLQRPIRWGIVGCGDVCEVKSGPAFSKVEGSVLHAVMRRDARLAEDYARRHKVPLWFSEAETLISHPEIDAIYVATPPGSHEQFTLAAAAAGKPVYVEKPMAPDAASCRRMIAAFENAGVPLFVAYYRRSLPHFEVLRKRLTEGALGDIRCVNLVLRRPPSTAEASGRPDGWRVNSDISGGGHFFDLACHQLDILDFLLGPISAASGTARNQAGYYNAEDTVCAHFEFATGALGTGLWCFDAGFSKAEERIEISGTLGTAVCSAFQTSPFEIHSGGGITTIPVTNPPHVQQPLIASVVRALRGESECPSTGLSALRTAEVMDDMTRGG